MYMLMWNRIHFNDNNKNKRQEPFECQYFTANPSEWHQASYWSVSYEHTSTVVSDSSSSSSLSCSRQVPFRLFSMTTLVSRCLLAVLRFPYWVNRAICFVGDWLPFTMFCQGGDQKIGRHDIGERIERGCHLVTCPKMDSRRFMNTGSTDDSLTRARISSLRICSYQRLLRIRRRHFMWKASSVVASAETSFGCPSFGCI